MTASDQSSTNKDLPEALVSSPRRGPSVVWVIPIIALLVGGWLLYRTFAESGPEISISFPNADGIEAGKTRIKYLDVDIGLVTEVRLGENGSSVFLTAEMEKGVDARLSETSQFWVVRPRIGVSGVSGIGTLFSGAYIALDPGAGGTPKRSFEGLIEPPKILSNQQGQLFKLRAKRLHSVSLGSPVKYRDIPVGEVVNMALAADYSHVGIEIFINAPHDKIVKPTSRFWNISGLEMNLSADGLEVELESFVTLLSGGISFSTPTADQHEKPAPAESIFPLYDDEKESKERPIVVTYPYLVYFEDTVRGLSPGAPVEFRGIRVGTVDSIKVKRTEEDAMVIGALLAIEPERLDIYGAQRLEDSEGAALERTKRLVQDGLRLQLKTGNIITGQLFVDLEFLPDAEPVEIVMEKGIPVLPSVPSKINSLIAQLSKIVTKIESFPIDEIGQHAERTVAGIDTLVNGGELQQAIASISAAALAAEGLVGAVDQNEIKTAIQNLNNTLATTSQLTNLIKERAGPLLDDVDTVARNANALIKDARDAAAQAEKTLASIEDVTSEDGKIGTELLGSLQQLRAAARSIRIFAEYLERNPQALVRGKN
jgi:paraquat-inducible protein B